MNKINYFEDLQKTVVDLAVDKNEYFNYVATSNRTGRKLDEASVAFGAMIERKCVDLSNREIVGKVEVLNEKRRTFVKIIAEMPEWRDLVVSITLTVNDTVLLDKEKVLFEQVYLGWPSFYVAIPDGALKKGENVIKIKAEGSNLYLSELSLVSFPEMKNISQVSCAEIVKEGERFAVAIKDSGKTFEKIENLNGAEFLGVKYYKEYCILPFRAKCVGNASCTAYFSGKKVVLDMPEVVQNIDQFLIGTDSDDHRQDDTSETYFIIENFLFSAMGNFVQFRPKKGRNFFEIIPENKCKELVDLMRDFGVKFGLSDPSGIFAYLTDYASDIFFGYHIHENYLFFNFNLSEKHMFRRCFTEETQRVLNSQSFTESKDTYMQVLSKSKDLFSKEVGLTSFGSASLLCCYEGNSGIDRINIEPVSNINLLTGSVRATKVKSWGAHVPPDWYFGTPVDKIKSNKYRLAMQYLYLNGASSVYAENGLFKTKAFDRCDWESDFCVYNRNYLREFYKYTLTHPRKGNLIVDKAIVYGRNESVFWKQNDRMAELKDFDWDMKAWGKWNNDYQIAWNSAEAWLPVSDKQNAFKARANKNLFSGTPYGNVDVVYADNDFSKYKTLAFLGWNTMTDDLLERIKSFVKSGGTLMISYSQFNYTDRNDREMTYPKNDKIKEFLGVDITNSAPMGKKLSFASGDELVVEKEMTVACGDLLTAKPICLNENGVGVVYENDYGKGKVYFIANKEYITCENDTQILSTVLKLIGKDSDMICNNNNISFTLREDNQKYYLSVLNMNCIDGADEEYELIVKGRNISGAIKVGEIQDFVFDK